MTPFESFLPAPAPWSRAVTGMTALLARLRPRRRRTSGSERVGPYVLGEKLGEGGMGVVYKGRHARFGRPVAIKVLPQRRASSANVRRFEREAQLTQQLNHPNTIEVYDVGRTRDGLPYYAMEYVDGPDLQTLVEREGPLAPERVAQLLAQLAGALSEVHAAGLIQGDVKPANAMLCRRATGDVVKLLDFGLSRAIGERLSEEPTHYAPLAGTPLYLPPEAITAPETLDARSDLYSLGALGYFLLTGVPPFSGNSLAEVCGHHLHSAPIRPSTRLASALPARLEALLLACLEKSPARRPASAAALQAALLPLAAPRSRQCAPARQLPLSIAA